MLEPLLKNPYKPLEVALALILPPGPFVVKDPEEIVDPVIVKDPEEIVDPDIVKDPEEIVDPVIFKDPEWSIDPVDLEFLYLKTFVEG